MKLLRVFLLSLLAMMLPVRGVMAAAMTCAPTIQAAGGEHAMAAPEAALHGHAPSATPHHEKADHHEADHHQVDSHRGDSAHHDGASGSDTCNLCSACCSVPPVASSAPAIGLPQVAAAGVFPSLSVQAPSFLSGGPERPPRSI